jgi:CRP-like cAMP-binding protein
MTDVSLRAGTALAEPSLVIHEMTEAQELLGDAPICRGVTPAIVADLARNATLVHKARGEELYSDTAPAGALFLISRGVVKLLQALDSGRDIIIELAGRGDIIGEAALTEQDLYGTRAVCVHPTTALMIPRADAAAYVANNPEAVRNVVALLHACIRRARQRVEDMAVFGVRQRIARFLVRLADWTGRPEDGNVLVPVALSRQELAALTGTTVETAIRVMSALRQQGLVEPARRGIVLRDRAELEQLAAGKAA